MAKTKTATHPSSLLQYAELKPVVVRPIDVGRKFIFLGEREDDRVLNRAIISTRVQEYAENLDVVARDGNAIELINNGDETYSIVDGQNRISAVRKANRVAMFMAFIYPRALIEKVSHPFSWRFIRSRMVAGRSGARTTLPQMLRMHAMESPWIDYVPELAPEIDFTLDQPRRSTKSVRIQYKLLVQAYTNQKYFKAYYAEHGVPPKAVTCNGHAILQEWITTPLEDIGASVAAVRWWAEHCLSHRTRSVQKLILTVRGLTMMMLFYEKYGKKKAAIQAASKFASIEVDVLRDTLRLHRSSTREYVNKFMYIANFRRRKGSLFEVLGSNGRMETLD